MMRPAVLGVGHRLDQRIDPRSSPSPTTVLSRVASLFLAALPEVKMVIIAAARRGGAGDASRASDTGPTTDRVRCVSKGHGGPNQVGSRSNASEQPSSTVRRWRRDTVSIHPGDHVDTHIVRQLGRHPEHPV
jgi:hypothetical protein